MTLTTVLRRSTIAAALLLSLAATPAYADGPGDDSGSDHSGSDDSGRTDDSTDDSTDDDGSDDGSDDSGSGARDGRDEVLSRGACTMSSDWKVKAKRRDGRIEIEGEVDTSRVGQSWTWKLKHNGSLSARGTETTTAPSGSFSVERRTADLAGADSFVFWATNPASGESCRGTLSL